MYVQNHDNARKVFFDDVRERKSIGRGAHYQKRGSKSRKCSLPSDHLTEGEWKKMNGPVMSVNMNAPMNWSEFKNLSREMQNQYIKMLVSKFNATKVVIAEAFGTSFTTLTKGIIDCGASDLFRPGKKMKQAERDALLSFFGMQKESAETEVAVCETDETENTAIEVTVSETACENAETVTGEVVQPVAASKFAMRDFEVTFEGAFDADHVANSLRYMVPAGTSVRLKISCEILG